MVYTIVDWLLTLLSCALAVGLPVYKKQASYLLIGLASYFLYPIPMELVYNILTRDDKFKKQKRSLKHNGLPIVYHPDYNITACGIEKWHPFDSCKYRRVYDQLLNWGVMRKDQVFVPEMCSRSLLLDLGMSRCYLLKLCYSLIISKVVEVPVFFLPACFLRWRLLDAMLLATSGTMDGVCLAIEHGWAINIGGGFHHANLEGGGGFCVYPDITLAIRYLRKLYPDRQKVMIVDLDAHQGNGHERDHLDDPETYIVDFYNHYIYPRDALAAQAIKQNIYVSSRDSDDAYCAKLRETMELSIREFEPQFVIYNAGTDCMMDDPLGNMNLSAACIIERDDIMFEMCKRYRVPILMVTSGGYQMTNAPTIAASIRSWLAKQK